MTGRTYLLRGEPVHLVCTFVLPSKRNPSTPCPPDQPCTTPGPGEAA